MLQAFLRGWLSKGRKFGGTSRLRDEMIIQATGAILDAEYAERQNLLLAVVASGSSMDGRARQKILRDIQSNAEKTDLLRYSDFDGVKEHTFANSSLAAETLYDLMKEAGLVGNSNPVE